MRQLIIIILLTLSVIKGFCQDQVIPFTLADRDRIIRLDSEVSALRSEFTGLRNEFTSFRNETDAKFKSVDTRFEAIDDKLNTMFLTQGIIISLIIGLIGFIFWDRCASLAPVKKDIYDLKNTDEKIINVFHKQSEFQPKLKDILKNSGIP